MTKISLVRHGLVENPDQVYYGRLSGFKLADEGREQAAAAGQVLAQDSVAAIYHSPMLRASQTAEILRAQSAEPVPLVECDLLNEIYSPFDGQTIAEMERRNWDCYGDTSAPYEQPAEVLARILAFFQRMRQEHPGAARSRRQSRRPHRLCRSVGRRPARDGSAKTIPDGMRRDRQLSRSGVDLHFHLRRQMPRVA